MRLSISAALVLLQGRSHAANQPLPKGIVSLPIIPILNQTAYGALLEVGTPPQRNILLVDTGSSETPGFSAPGSVACTKNRCARYGTYNNLTSSTAVFVSNDYGTAVGADPYGGFINDTVSFGGRVFANFTIGQQLAFQTPSHLPPGDQYGFLGLAQYCNAARVCRTFNTVLQQLHRRGDIIQNYFSLYLGPPNGSTQGEILYGGIDKAKQGSKPFAVNMNLDPSASNETNMVLMSSWSLTLAANGKQKTTRYAIPSGQNVTLVDSGNPTASFSAPMARAILNFLNVSAPLYQSPYTVDCRFRHSSTANAATVFFNRGHNNISMPLASFVSRLDDGTCSTQVDGFGFAIGAPMIRNMYLGYDMDSQTLYFSQVKYTDKRNVVPA